MRFGNADEAVHDSPHRAEQPDERRGCADGGEHAGAAADAAAERRLDSLEARSDALLETVLVVGSVDRRTSATAAAHSCRAGPFAPESLMSESDTAEPSTAMAERARCLASASSMALARQTVQVTTDATTSPTMTAFTTISADINMPQGLRSRGSTATPMAASGTDCGACARATLTSVDPTAPASSDNPPR